VKGDNISRSRSEGRVGGRRLVSVTKEPYRTATLCQYVFASRHCFHTTPVPISSKQSQVSTKIFFTSLALLCPVSEAKNLHLQSSKQKPTQVRTVFK
jgi:hypothetical protein